MGQSLPGLADPRIAVAPRDSLACGEEFTEGDAFQARDMGPTRLHHTWLPGHKGHSVEPSKATSLSPAILPGPAGSVEGKRKFLLASWLEQHHLVKNLEMFHRASKVKMVKKAEF